MKQALKYNTTTTKLLDVEMKMVIAQPLHHQNQQQRDQHEAKTKGDCGKLAAENFATLGKFSGHTNKILILLVSVLLKDKFE